MIEWKDIKGYEGIYQISNNGIVKSLKRNVTYSNGKVVHYKEKIVKPAIHNCYYAVTLHKNGLKRTVKVHRLVAEHFISNPLNLPCINHKDENKLNNNVDNLEWCTVKYNSNYNNAQERKAKSCWKPIYQLDLNGNVIKLWDSPTEVEKELGILKSSISNQIAGRIKTAGGYLWRY